MTSPVVTFTPAWIDACALVRLFIPHLHLPKSRFVFHAVRTPVEKFLEGEIVVVQRQCSAGNMQALKSMHDMGLKVIYDLDDDLWGIPGSSPAKRIFEPVKEGFGRCMEFCDAITVSTEPLRTAVRTAEPQLTKRKEIFVVPNGIDFDYMREPLLPKPEGTVTVGWGGSNTHAGDIGVAWQVLPELLHQLPQMRLEFVGMNPPKKIIGHERVRMREFCPVGEYMSRYPAWGWDITLAPLDNVRFNRSKSGLKALEAAAIGAVCLMSPVKPYEDICNLSTETKWLLCRSPQQWRDKIKALVEDESLRKQMAEALRKVVAENFAQDKLMPKWHDVFSYVTEQKC